MGCRSDQPSGPADRHQRLLQYLDLTGRIPKLMVRLFPGRVTREVIGELQDLYKGFGELIDGGPLSVPSPSLQDLRLQQVDVLEYVARAYDALRETRLAAETFERAAKEYDALSRLDRGDQCRARKLEILQSETGDHDAEYAQLLKQVSNPPKDPLQHADLLVKLGELCGMAGDDYQAMKHLTAAEAVLEAAGIRNPSEGSLGAALGQSMKDIESNRPSAGAEESPIVRALAVRALFKRLFQAMIQTCRQSDPKRADHYSALLAELDKTGPHKEFGDELFKIFGQFLR